MKRISKRVREEAIEALEIAAFHEPPSYVSSGSYDIAPRGSVADALVDQALDAVRGAAVELWSNGRFLDSLLEAAALLREGWNPGEPVIRLSPPSQEGGGR